MVVGRFSWAPSGEEIAFAHKPIEAGDITGDVILGETHAGAPSGSFADVADSDPDNNFALEISSITILEQVFEVD